jgi:hypothetical protein
MADQLKIHDRVLVRRGFNDVEARVLEVYGDPDNLQVVLAMPILGSSGEVLAEETVSLPARAVRRVAAA